MTSVELGAAPRRVSPFLPVRLPVAVATAYAVTAGVWVLAGTGLPGGRWFAIHLFTLGVVSNLVAALSVHFAETLLHQPGGGLPAWRLALYNAGALGVLGGMLARSRWVVVAGATLAVWAVFALYRQLRHTRRSALTQRFAFVVRTYERACGAFLHGAVLGGLLGAGVLPGSWASGARLAHLHTNVLGWGGLTLLATLVMFGPTVLRTRLVAGADVAAARWLPRAATALSVAVLALVASGAPAPWGTAARVLAGAALAVYAAAAVVVCSGVLRAAVAARRRSAGGLLLLAACVWLPLAAVGDAVAVVLGRWAVLDALGVAVLVGVLGQAIVASVGYFAPMLRRDSTAREAVRRRVDAAAAWPAIVLNAGVAALVLAALTDTPSRPGVVLAGVAVAGYALLLVWPARRADPQRA